MQIEILIFLLILLIGGLFGGLSFEHQRSLLRRRAKQLLLDIDAARKLHNQMEAERSRAIRDMTDAIKKHVEAVESKVLKNTPVAFLKKFGSGFSVSPLESSGIGNLLQLDQFGLGRLEQLKGVGPTTAGRIRQALIGAMNDLKRNQINLRPDVPYRSPAEASLVRQAYLQMCAARHIHGANDQLAVALASIKPEESIVRRFSKITGWLVNKATARNAIEALGSSMSHSGPVAATVERASGEFSRWREVVVSANSPAFIENDFLSRRNLYWEFLGRLLPFNREGGQRISPIHDIHSPDLRGRSSIQTPHNTIPVVQGTGARSVVNDRQGAGGGRQQQAPRLTWYPANHSLSFAGLDLGCGMIYAAAEAPEWPGEPSAIITSLSVAGSAADSSQDIGYYPDYQQMTPQQRRCYLEWLASGRNDQDPQCRALGYVFTFFYGLERRILVDADRDPSLIEEIMRLVQVYDKASGSRSFHGYSLNLLHFAGWQLGTEAYRALWPRVLRLDEERPSHEGMHFVLANLFQTGEPLHWSVAYRIAMGSDESRRSNIVLRAREKFWQLFEQRYRDQFSDGLVLQKAIHLMVARYRPASRALLCMQDSRGGSDPFELRIPNVASVHRQLRDLPKIWNSCVEDLAGYSRALCSRKQGGEAALAAWKTLPANLQRTEEHPLKQAFDEMLGAALREGDHLFVTSGSVASLLGIGERAKLTNSQSKEIEELVSDLGWQMAPHPGLTGLPLAWDQEVVLYAQDAATGDSPQLPGILRLLYLAVIIAASDGTISTEELETFRRMIAEDAGREYDAKAIGATEAALCRDANVALRALPLIVKFIPASNRKTVLRTLAHIAAADDEVTVDEVRILQRIGRAFGIEAGWIEQLLNEDVEFREVQVAGGRGKRSGGESIPTRPDGHQSVFRLDEDRIKALTKETNEVISLLSSVMAEPDEGPAAQPTSTTATKDPDRTSSPAWLTDLDLRCHAPLLTLTQFDEITTGDFDRIAAEHHLMPDDMLDTINAWADDALGDFLLERGENIRVHRSLLPDLAEFSVAA